VKFLTLNDPQQTKYKCKNTSRADAIQLRLFNHSFDEQ
jgi:hypothetical protein